MTTRFTNTGGARSVSNGASVSALVGRLADEMIGRWRAGANPRAEEYLDRHPELWQNPDAALELIAEELALREEHGQAIPPSELARRFPAWRSQVETLWQCQYACWVPTDTRRVPAAGDDLGEFRLVAELGRGANGRVFLATQSPLGDRAIVLKLVPGAGGEHLSLARLQHTHIVPLYSVHEFPEHGLRALCMPHFGKVTLAALLAGIAGRPAPTGKHFLAALREAESWAPAPLPVAGPACDLLQGVSYAEAVCQIGACLADALAYAHERGLVHLDIKPSNVLLGADGVPMLLDFHLARPPLRAGDPAPAWLGGTPEYMAPELATAVEAVRAGAEIPVTVDERADIYSLGLLLREALVTPEESGCARVSRGLRDVLARCTAPNPVDRYPGAAQLAADLRRHLADLPLRGVPNRSIAERWRKWRRRRPFAFSGMLIAAGMMCALVGASAHFYRQTERATVALREGETHTQHGRYVESIEVLRGGEGVLHGVPGSATLAQRLRTARQSAERARSATELHQFCERVRELSSAEVIAPATARGVEIRCEELWAERQQIASRLDGQPTAELEKQWRGDLLDLGILTAYLRVRLAAPAGAESAHRQALIVLDEAEILLGPSGVLHQERAAHEQALGMHERAAESTRRAAAFPPKTAWEHLITGRTALATGDLLRAATEFERCLELDPGSLWGNNYRGMCLLRLGDATGAASAFSACVALAPRTPWCFYNRGLANTELDRLDWARADFDRALALDPEFAAALLGRALVHHRAGRFADALADLRSALGAGLAPDTVHYHRAMVHLAAGDRSAAIAALRDCLAQTPTHIEARAALTRLESDH